MIKLQIKYNWQFLNKNNSENKEKQLAEKLNVSNLCVELLNNRNINDFDKAKKWLNPTTDLLHDPWQLGEMKKAIERLEIAIEKQEKITIYGDYDVDGVTSTALMYETLINLGANVDFYIPNRFLDGYGPNLDKYKQLIEEGTQLILTVDNGVSGNEAVNYAQSKNVDVVITDHHQLPNQLPNAYAIVHPQYPEKNYPFSGLSGVGVAFKVAQCLQNADVNELFEDLDLLALGEVADLVPLVDENHVLVKWGLQSLRDTERIGLQVLADKAGINLHNIDSSGISFGLAARLNTLGRMDNANEVVNLLTTFDEQEAEQIASKIEKLNSQRQNLVNEIVNETLDQLEDDVPVNILVGTNWHEGVLGIVASRIVNKTNKPTVILTKQENGILKGSGRSVDGFNLFAAINPIRDELVSFGGHAMACGLSLTYENLSLLKTTLIQQIDNQKVSLGKPNLNIDGKLSLKEFNQQNYDDIQKLGPFGIGNPEPIFEVSGKIDDVKLIGTNQKHVKFTLKDNNTKLTLLGFNFGEYYDEFNSIDQLTFIGQMSVNEWKGNKEYQLVILDIDLPEFSVIDNRINRLDGNVFNKEGMYVFFNQQLFQKYKDKIDKPIVLYSQLNDHIETDNLILVDIPDSIEQLQNCVNKIQWKKIYLNLYDPFSVYYDKIPDRNMCNKVFHYFRQHKQIIIKHDRIIALSKYLKISYIQLIWLIGMFFEIGFVKIDHGVITNVSDLPRKSINIQETKAFRIWNTKLKTEEKLLYSSRDELVKFIMSMKHVD